MTSRDTNAWHDAILSFWATRYYRFGQRDSIVKKIKNKMKKVCEIFCSIENILYLCTIFKIVQKVVVIP